MGKFVDEIRSELKDIKEKLGENTTQLAVYNSHLQDHMRRTEIQEERSEGIDERVQTLEKKGYALSLIFKLAVTLLTSGAVLALIKHFL